MPGFERSPSQIMRVLYVVHQFFPRHISGTEQYVLALAKAGRAAGDDVRVFTVDPDWGRSTLAPGLTKYEFEGVPVAIHKIDPKRIHNWVLLDWWNPQVGPSFEQMLDEFRPDVVHVFHLRYVGIDRLDELEKRRIPFVVHLMDFWFICPNFLLLREEPVPILDQLSHVSRTLDGKQLVQCDGPPDSGYGCFDCVHTGMLPWAREEWTRTRNAERRAAGEFPADEESGEQAGFAMTERPRRVAAALRRAATVISPSRTVKSALEKAGLAPPQLEIVPYAIDWSLLDGLPPAPTDAVHVGFMGTFGPHKGLAVLLEAFRGLDRRDVRLHGYGRFGDFPAYDQKLRELAAGDERIVFHGPFARKDLAKVIGGLHVLVVPSLWRENTPFVCLEARAAGVELVTSALEGMTECVPAGRGGSFEVGEARALQRQLETAIGRVKARRLARLERDPAIPSLDRQYSAFRERYAAARPGTVGDAPP